MTNKIWRKKIAVLLAGAMLCMHMPTVPIYAEEATTVAQDELSDKEEKEKDKDDKQKEETPAAPAETPAAPAETPAAPAETPAAPAETPAAPAETPAAPAETPAAPAETPTAPAETPAAPAETPAAPAETPTAPAETPAAPTETPAAPTETPAAPTETPAASAETPTAPVDTPAAPVDTPAAPTETPAAPAETPAAPAETPAATAETPSGAVETPITPAETPASSSETPAAPAETPTAPAETLAANAETPASEEKGNTNADIKGDAKVDSTDANQENTEDSSENNLVKAAEGMLRAAGGEALQAEQTAEEEGVKQAAEEKTDAANQQTNAGMKSAAASTEQAEEKKEDTSAQQAEEKKEDTSAQQAEQKTEDTSTQQAEQKTEDTSAQQAEQKTEDTATAQAEDKKEDASANQADTKKDDSSDQQTPPPPVISAAPETALIKTASAIVHWEDADDANDIRPGFMVVTLQKSTDGGATYSDVETYTLNAGNDWKVQLEDLTGMEDGKEVTYRWDWEVDDTPEGSLNEVEDSDEHNLVGYVRTQNDELEDGTRSERTYTHVLQKRAYTIVINWDDAGDKSAVIPETLDVVLPDGRTVTVKASDGWKLDVEIPIVHRDLEWSLGAAEGWRSDGNYTDYDEDSTIITFNRKWTTTTEIEPAGMSTLKIQYWIGSTEAAPMFLGVYENGQTYNVSVPKVTGYKAKVTRVKGVINGDTVINVKYVPITYNVTVYYRYLNGQTAAPTAYRSMKTGTSYSIGSPAIGGYAASVSLISGTVTGRDLTYVVYYTGTGGGVYNGAGREEEQMVDVNTIDDYKTPLGLGEIGINAGECFE